MQYPIRVQWLQSLLLTRTFDPLSSDVIALPESCKYGRDQGMLFSTRTKIKKLFFDSLTQLTKKGNHQNLFCKCYLQRSKCHWRRLVTLPRGSIQIQNEVIDRLIARKTFLFERFIKNILESLLCFSRSQHFNPVNFWVQEPLRPSNWFMLRRWTEVRRLV